MSKGNMPDFSFFSIKEASLLSHEDIGLSTYDYHTIKFAEIE